MIVRIPRFLCVLYHAHGSHQSSRTSTVCITALPKERAEGFTCFLFIVLIVAVIELFYDEIKTTKCYTKTLCLLSLLMLFALARSWRVKVCFNTWRMLLGVWVHLELTEPLLWWCNHLSQQWKPQQCANKLSITCIIQIQLRPALPPPPPRGMTTRY